MPDKIKMNFNNMVLVKIKPQGLRIIRNKWNEHLPENRRYSMEDIKNKIDSDGFMSFHLWEFIQLFGDKILFGKSPDFELDFYLIKE